KAVRTGFEHRGETSVGTAEDGHAIFRREGEFWMLAYRGTTLRLKDVKGLAYLAFLLAHPGERFHVHDLIARVEGVADTGSRIAAQVTREVSTTHDLGDAGAASISRPRPTIVAGCGSWLRNWPRPSDSTTSGAWKALRPNRTS